MEQVKTERVLGVLIGVTMLVLIGVIADSIREQVIRVGDRAPDFSITSDSGRRISPADFGGKLLVLNFWATWCPPCIREMPSLDRFQEQLRDAGVVVLGISVDKNERAYRRFLDRARVSFQTTRDAEAKISASFGTYRYPETYVIGRDGKVIMKVIADRDWMEPEMLRSIRSLL